MTLRSWPTAILFVVCLYHVCGRLLTLFDRLRRKRNMALYDDTGFISCHDAEQALEAAHDYSRVLRADIAARKP